MRILKRKNLMASIAQVLLAVILLPFVCVVLRALIPDSGGDFFLNLFGELPVWGNMTAMLGGLLMRVQEGEAVNLLEFFYRLIVDIQKEILETTIMGMCIYACKSVGILLYLRGIPVLQALAGIFLGTITVASIRSENRTIFGIVVFLFLLNMVLTILVESGQWVKKILAIFLGMGMQSIIAGFMVSYISVIAYLLSGAVENLYVAVELLGVTLIPFLCLLSLDYMFFTPKKL